MDDQKRIEEIRNLLLQVGGELKGTIDTLNRISSLPEHKYQIVKHVLLRTLQLKKIVEDPLLPEEDKMEKIRLFKEQIDQEFSMYDAVVSGGGFNN